MNWYKSYGNPTITVKVKRRYPVPFRCESCKSIVEPKQSRNYNKETHNYLCWNYYDCGNCGFKYKTEQSIVPEYQSFPRLNDLSFEDREHEIEIPVGMGECLNVEVVKVNLK